MVEGFLFKNIMPYLILTKHIDQNIYYLQDIRVTDGMVRREWTTNKSDTTVLFVSDSHLQDFIDTYLYDIKENLEVLAIRTTPKPSSFKPITT